MKIALFSLVLSILFAVAKLNTVTPQEMKAAMVIQTEYLKQIERYLFYRRISGMEPPEKVPVLITGEAEIKLYRDKLTPIDVLFPEKYVGALSSISNAGLRLLMPKATAARQVFVKVFKSLSDGSPKYLSGKTLKLSTTGPEWFNIDITPAFINWVYEPALAIHLEGFSDSLENMVTPLKASWLALAIKKENITL